jgi:hypothetical protein
VASGPGRGRASHQGSLHRGRWRSTSDVEGDGTDVKGDGAGDGSISGAWRRLLENGCGDGPAMTTPAQGSGGWPSLVAVEASSRSGQWCVAPIRWQWRPSGAMDGGGGGPPTLRQWRAVILCSGRRRR